jgi:tetratricopeptide (TPR) repeat protein
MSPTNEVIACGFRTITALAAFFLIPDLHAAERPWHLLESSRFTIVSQLSEKDTRAWAAEFDEYVYVVNQRLSVNERFLKPLTIVLFARDRDFYPYKPFMPDGTTRDVSGFFASRATWSVIGLPGGFGKKDTRQIIFHEGVHWVTDAHSEPMPPWMLEGLAEVYSTFRSKKGRVSWGYTIPDHMQTFRNESLLPLKTLLTTSIRDPLFNEITRTGVFYAQSWALVHYLTYGKSSKYENALVKFSRAANDGATIDDAFAYAFGATFKEVENDLMNYVRRGSYFVVQQNLSGYNPNGYTMRKALSEEVEIAFARLAMGANRHDLALEHARKAVEIAPENPAGYELLAWVTLEKSQQAISKDQGFNLYLSTTHWPNLDKILEYSKRATELGSEDAWMYFLLGVHCQFPGFLNEISAEGFGRYAADQYGRAISLRPNLRPAYQNLSIAVGTKNVANKDDFAFLLEGNQLYPRDSMIILGLASIAEQEGDLELALEYLAAAKADGTEKSSASGATGRSLELRLTEGNLDLRIDALVAKNDVSGVLALYDLEIARAKNPQLRRTLEQKRFHFMYETKTNLAFNAADADDFDAAIDHLEVILKMDGLTPDQRTSVIDNIRQMTQRRLDSL